MPDIELDIGLQLIASIETLTTALAKQEREHQRRSQAIRQIPLTAPQASGSPLTIDSADNLAVKTGYYWSVRRLTLSGFTAGTAVVYLNNTSGEPVEFFSAAASLKYAKGAVLMHPGDRLIVVGSSITGVVQLNGAVDCFEARYLYDYLT